MRADMSIMLSNNVIDTTNQTNREATEVSQNWEGLETTLASHRVKRTLTPPGHRVDVDRNYDRSEHNRRKRIRNRTQVEE